MSAMWMRSWFRLFCDLRAGYLPGLVKVGFPVNEEAERIIRTYIPYIQTTHSAPVTGVHMNPAKLLPADRRFYTYKGTKTTPACKDNLRFVIYKAPIYISLESYYILQRTHTNEHHHGINLSEFGNRRPLLPPDYELQIQANFRADMWKKRHASIVRSGFCTECKNAFRHCISNLKRNVDYFRRKDAVRSCMPYLVMGYNWKRIP